MPISDFFRRKTPDSESPDQSGYWPPAPALRQPPAGALGRLEALRPSPAVEADPFKYGPALVLGFGPTGEQVLRQWLALMAQDSAGRQERLRTILLTHQPVTPIATETVTVRQFDLVTNSTLQELSRTGPGSEGRHQLQRLFRLAANFRPFLSYLTTCVQEMGSDSLRVILLGSLLEREIGLVGEVLLALHLLQQQSRSRLLLDKTALLTLNSPAGANLDEGESYAALREIGRFTFNGPHFMPAPASYDDQLIQTTMLDYVFLVEGAAPPYSVEDLRQTPFASGMGQALAETLFTLLHPAGQQLWGKIHADLQAASEARQQTHVAHIHSLAVATLYVPLTEVKNYVAARLAYAALLGEPPSPDRPRDQRPEGLLAHSPLDLSPSQNSAWQARQWLLNGPFPHPLFDWLLRANGPAYFRELPPLTTDHDLLFQGQVAHSLTAFLNDPTGEDLLPKAQAIIQWLRQHLQQIQEWQMVTARGRPKDERRVTLSYLLERWQAGLLHWLQSLETWQRVLSAEPEVQVERPADWRGRGSSALAGDWRGGRVSPTTDWRGKGGTPGSNWQATPAGSGANSGPLSPSAPRVTSLITWLREQKQAAEVALTEAAGGAVRQALTADTDHGLGEVERYYTDTVRPELEHLALETSGAFRRVRERLGWWVELSPGRLPQLYLICLPVRVAGGGAAEPPPREGRFTPDELAALGHCLLEVAREQAQGLEADLTGRWFEQRLLDQGKFLHRANKPFLSYDQETAARYHYLAARHSYIVRHNRTLLQPELIPKLKGIAFPTLSATEVEELSNGLPTRLSALSLWLKIPMEAVLSAQRFYESYGHREEWHLYPQESAATRYENRLDRAAGRSVLLSPELTLALVDKRLVTLFCQAFFARLIVPRANEDGLNPQWTVLAPDERFSDLALAAHDERWSGLWAALRAFALELPYGPNLGTKPTHPFHPLNRQAYLDALRSAIQRRQEQPDYEGQRSGVGVDYLEPWRRSLKSQPQNVEQDLLAEGFLNLLQVEWDKPMGW